MEPGATRGGEVEVEPPSLLGLEPALDGRTLMGAVVVENEMDIQLRWHLPFQLIEELNELPAAMARQATADHPAVQNIEGGKQGRGPMPLVVMRLAFGHSWTQRQNRSGAVQGLNLALFVDAEH